ncbi:MAG: tetratricopeptide repeat protein [Deltaproteobacteria bacterium]
MWGLVWLACLVMGCVPASGTTTPDDDRSDREFKLAAALRSEGQTASAIEHLHISLELNPDNAEAHLLLGFIQMERRDYEKAEKDLRTAIKLLEKQKRGGSTLAEARNIYGLCLIELERYEDAIVVLRQSAIDELNRAPHLAWGNLGLAQFHMGEYQETVKSTMEAVRIQPRFCVGYYTMARAMWHLQQLKDAERALVSALGADESCAKSVQLQGAWRLRGEVRARLGHRQDAIADLEQCVELDPYSNDGRMCQSLLEASQ